MVELYEYGRDWAYRLTVMLLVYHKLIKHNKFNEIFV